ncbi:MAG: DUF721 domain-containing protein [Cytophagales bacterium]|nr:DUF721 domain-containing protein [Cytophagales bacterium]
MYHQKSKFRAKADPRKKDTSTIKESIEDMLQSFHLKKRFDETKLINDWERLLGKTIAKRTIRLFVRNEVLFVEMSSPSLKHEMSVKKANILKIFFDEYQREIIKDVVFL